MQVLAVLLCRVLLTFLCHFPPRLLLLRACPTTNDDTHRAVDMSLMIEDGVFFVEVAIDTAEHLWHDTNMGFQALAPGVLWEK